MAELGLNQTQLSAKTGIERSELNRIVNDKRQPKGEELVWLAKALGLTVPALLLEIELPEVLVRQLVELEALAHRVLMSDAARDEAEAQRAELERGLASERQKWGEERRDLQQQLQSVRADAASRIAGSNRRADDAESRLAVERGERVEERAQNQRAIDGQNATIRSLREQVERLQQELVKERGSKVAVGLLASLAGLVGGAALASPKEYDDEHEEN